MYQQIGVEQIMSEKKYSIVCTDCLSNTFTITTEDHQRDFVAKCVKCGIELRLVF